MIQHLKRPSLKDKHLSQTTDVPETPRKRGRPSGTKKDKEQTNE